jgi:hypothetical protein
MPVMNYGVLKWRPIDRALGTGGNPQYQINVIDDTTDYRIAVNVVSALTPSELDCRRAPCNSLGSLCECTHNSQKLSVLPAISAAPTTGTVR